MNEKNCLLSANRPFIIPDGVSHAKLLVGASSIKGGPEPGYGYISAEGIGALTPGLNVNSVFVSNPGVEGLEYMLTCTFDVGHGNPGVLIYKNKGYGGPYECTTNDIKALHEDWKSHLGEEIDVYLVRAADLSNNVNVGGGVRRLLFMLAILFGGLRHEPEKGTFTNEQNHCSNAYNRSWYKTQFLFKGFGIWFLYKQFRKSNSVIIKKLFTLLFLFRNSYRGFCSSIKLPCSTVRLHTNNSFRYTKKHYFDAQGTKLCCKRRVFYLGRRRQNHRPDYRSCVASNATSLKGVA